MGLGVVIRDQQGKMWTSKCQTRDGYLDPTTGEALAALMAVELCVEMGIRRAVLEGDARNVITTVLANEPDNSIRGQITEDIRTTMRAVSWWQMQYVRREGNKVAHVLANIAVKEKLNKVWFYNPPDCIHDLLQAEMSALTYSI
jgi:ribonuclease HI